MESGRRSIAGEFGGWGRRRALKRILTLAAWAIGSVAMIIGAPVLFGSDPPWKGRIVGAQTIETSSGPVLLVYRARYGQVVVQAMLPPPFRPPAAP